MKVVTMTSDRLMAHSHLVMCPFILCRRKCILGKKNNHYNGRLLKRTFKLQLSLKRTLLQMEMLKFLDETRPNRLLIKS